MRYHRFFVNEPLRGLESYEISDRDLVSQIRRVLRMTVGGRLVLLDGSGFEYLAVITDLNESRVRCAIESVQESANVPRRKLTLAFSVIKKDKAEWVTEKGTEIGVAAFRPFLSARSEKKSLKQERLEVIAREAAEQSGRADIPAVFPVSGFSETLDSLLEEGRVILLSPEGDPLPDLFRDGKDAVALLVGPEGGFSDPEIKEARQKGAYIISLGAQTLRAETASIASASLFLL